MSIVLYSTSVKRLPDVYISSVCPQLFWERKLSGLSAFDIAEELVKTMDLPKGLQGGCTEHTTAILATLFESENVNWLW